MFPVPPHIEVAMGIISIYDTRTQRVVQKGYDGETFVSGMELTKEELLLYHKAIHAAGHFITAPADKTYETAAFKVMRCPVCIGAKSNSFAICGFCSGFGRVVTGLDTKIIKEEGLM